MIVRLIRIGQLLFSRHCFEVQQSFSGETLLHILVETFVEAFDLPLFRSFLKVLVQYNFNLMNSETCVQGETALFLAVKSSKLKFAMLLVANG